MVDRKSSPFLRAGPSLIFSRMFIVIAWWFISARKWFKGPVINVEHHMLGRDANVVEGVAKVDSSSDNDVPNFPKKAEEAGETNATPELK